MWEQVRSNRRRSLAVVAAMGVLLVALGGAIGWLVWPDAQGVVAGAAGAAVFWLVLWGVAMRQGDDIMLGMAGAREIAHSDHPTLVNVVEEMAIAAQLGDRPRVYVVDDPSPNAFAAGRDPRKASVAVTTGLLRILDRDELQGVVAHEIGHIRNRDVALMVTAGVMMGAIAMLAEVAVRVLRVSGGRRRSRSSGKDGGAQALVLVVAVALIVLSPLLAQGLYFALSRRREYLADASGAMFTRYPEGLARALEKLGASTQPLADRSRITAPMYIVRPLAFRRRLALHATHPPLEERIAILRAMGGGADFGAYDRAFERRTGRRIVGLHTLDQTAALAARGPSADAAPVGAPERARQASDALLSASGYVERGCAACVATLKVPPSLVGRVTRCPRCDGPLESIREAFGEA